MYISHTDTHITFPPPSALLCSPLFSLLSSILSAPPGNHDDPSRDGVGDPLAALDFFSATNLVSDTSNSFTLHTIPACCSAACELHNNLHVVR